MKLNILPASDFALAMAAPTNDISSAEARIENLEQQLRDATSHLQRLQTQSRSDITPSPTPKSQPSTSNAPQASPHFLLLLSDSALPLGSFAFSSGLESFLHHLRASLIFPTTSTPPSPAAAFTRFLPESVSSYASTSLPFVSTAWRHPAKLRDLDDLIDASILCTVGRRASTAQGRALVGLWERSFVQGGSEASGVLRDFATALKAQSLRGATMGDGRGEGEDEEPDEVSAHLAPLFGVVCRAGGMGLRETMYVFMLSHVKALVSAGVRANVFGPYYAQKVLASGEVRGMIELAVERERDRSVDDVAQRVVALDLWMGRHEILYSRIFNS